MLNIYQRLNEVRKNVSYIKKMAQVETYKAVTNDQVVAETRQWFIEMGIMILPSVTKSETIDTGSKTAKGNTKWRYEGSFAIRFVNCDEPTDFTVVEVDAHADDYGDKAPGKALSYATKSAVLKVLYLETGENDEARDTQNLTPGDAVDGAELANMISRIDTADDMEKLLDIYSKAFARCSKDKEAKAAVVRAKDARRVVLTAKSMALK